MRKTFYILIFLLFIANTSFSQNYIDYHKLINKAELEIVESNFEKSLNHYKTAFELVEKPFSKDLYNASLCSAKLQRDSLTYSLVKQMIEKGVQLKFFNNKSYRQFKKTKHWKKLKSIKNELTSVAEQNINKGLLTELEELARLDQKIRKRKYGYPMSDTIRKVDSLNMIKLINLIDEYGYPSENIIGVANPKKIFQKPQNIVLRHFFQGQTIEKASKNELGNRLFTALRNGKICPIQYSVWEDFRYMKIYKRHKYGIYAVALENGNFRKNKLNNIEEINGHRKKIGIGTYDEYISKIIFQENQKEFYFGINEGIIEF